MIERYTYKNCVWVDLESPTKEDARKVMEEFNLHPFVAEGLLLPTLRPKVDLYDNCIYLILHFPALKHSHQNGIEQEVDFIIGEKFIITTRYDSIDKFHTFSKVFEANSLMDKSPIGENAGFIFFYMIRELYTSLMHELDYMRDRLGEIEENIFKHKEHEMVAELSTISKSLLDFKRSTDLHLEVLKSFETASQEFFGENMEYECSVILGEYYKVANMIQSNFELMKELRETNNSLLSTKQNEAMRILTIMAFTTFPLSLIAQIFSLHTTSVPIIGHPYDFWIIVGLMATIALIMFLFFKFKKWL